MSLATIYKTVDKNMEYIKKKKNNKTWNSCIKNTFSLKTSMS